jgi:hypothetical protein
MPSLGSAARHGASADQVGGVGTSARWYFGPTAHPHNESSSGVISAEFHLSKRNTVSLEAKFQYTESEFLNFRLESRKFR